MPLLDDDRRIEGRSAAGTRQSPSEPEATVSVEPWRSEPLRLGERGYRKIEMPAAEFRKYVRELFDRVEAPSVGCCQHPCMEIAPSRRNQMQSAPPLDAGWLRTNRRLSSRVPKDRLHRSRPHMFSRTPSGPLTRDVWVVSVTSHPSRLLICVANVPTRPRWPPL